MLKELEEAVEEEKEREEGLLRTFGFIGSVVAIILAFLISPLFSHRYFAFFTLQSGLSLLVFSTLCLINGRSYVLIPGILLAVAFIVLGAIGIYLNSVPFIIAAYGAYALFAALGIYILLCRVLSARVISTNMLFGALMVYLLSGIFWGKVFLVIEYLVPGSVHFSYFEMEHDPIKHVYLLQFNLLYYSFTTLSTLGIGDIVPVHHLAKAMTAIEALYGQMFVGIVIAKLVTVWGNSKIRNSLD